MNDIKKAADDVRFLKCSGGITGYLHHGDDSHKKARTRPTRPIMRGAKILGAVHAYIVPPYVKAQRIEKVDAMRIKFPTISTRLSLSHADSSCFHLTCRNNMRSSRATPPNGRLM